MLQIHIGNISEQGLNMEAWEDATALPLLSALAGEGSTHFTSPIHVRLRATLSGQTVLIHGTADSEVRIPCSRCLEPFEMKIESDFSGTAVPEVLSKVDPADADEIELTADDMDVIAYSGDSIDLGGEIAQQIIMALPVKPLCHDACKGMCSRCGADLNKTPCQCQPEDENGPFAVLKTRAFPNEQE
jgi:uncharacterized protein